MEGANLTVVVTNGTQVAVGGGETWTVGQLVLASNTTVWCWSSNAAGQVNNQWAGVGATIQAQSMEIAAGADLDADGQGYASAQGSGAGVRNSWAGGGGHGGMGGTANASGGSAYGSLTQPIELGSGGSDSGNPGGGAIKLIVSGTLLVDGLITANAVHLANHGGGAGGSIWIKTGTLAGAGIIQANGAQGGNDNGGGGGRIAIDYQVNDYSGTVTAWGGLNGQSGSVVGGAGTILWQGVNNPLASVMLDNGGYPGAYTPADLIEGTNLVVSVTNGTQVVIEGGETWTVNQLFVATNSAIFCFSTNNTALVNERWAGSGVTIAAQSVMVNAGGTITADGFGYVAGAGPGAGIRGAWGGGGGYGGMGGTVNASGGETNGSLNEPLDLGSGGSDGGANGGGAIQMIVPETLQVDGLITAGGVGSAWTGGSGGSIWLEVGTLSGNGMVRADGGPAGNNGGGGGRIAIYYWSMMGLADSQITVNGGSSSGQPGTLFVSSKPYFVLSNEPPYFHGSTQLSWTGAAIDPNIADSVRVTISRGGSVFFSADYPALPPAVVSWNSAGVPDGVYLLAMALLDSSSALISQVSQDILVNNSVAWHEGALLTSQTWASNTVHVIDQNIVIPGGVTLTLAPGAIIKFVKGAGITVQSNGLLNASGATAAAPIVFTSLADDSVGGDSNEDGNNSLGRTFSFL